MIKLGKLLKESGYGGKTLISVDIQPEYENHFSFSKNSFATFINKNYDSFNNLVFLYNGADTLGMISERDYIMWLYEIGIEEEILDSARFHDKGYAFFRECMGDADQRAISNFVRFMYDNDINDSRDMTREKWAEYLRQYRRTDKAEIYELLKNLNRTIFIPDLMGYIRSYRNILLVGGGRDECLQEVEIALDALNISYEKENKFVY